ncbi:MAG: hypothetical protein ACR2K1_01085 [Saprospiraceae bacterium]
MINPARCFRRAPFVFVLKAQRENSGKIIEFWQINAVFPDFYTFKIKTQRRVARVGFFRLPVFWLKNVKVLKKICIDTIEQLLLNPE